MKKEKITLKDGSIWDCVSFDKEDFKKFQTIYKQWDALNSLTNSMGGRKLNVPDVLSEGIFCLVFDAVRTNGSAYSYDAVAKKTKEGLQLKSACIHNDLTSFGPKSTWDKLYFGDFSFENVKGLVEFYLIPDEYIYNAVLNKKKNETFVDQQRQGRRPRLSIRSIIDEYKIKPIKKVNILTGQGIIKK